jgi:hypothetical protein
MSIPFDDGSRGRESIQPHGAVPVRIGNDILKSQIIKTLIAVSGFQSPLQILLRRQWKERKMTIPLSIPKSPADASQF